VAHTLACYALGLTPYGAAHRLQRELVERRRLDQIGDLALLLEHDPVITLGRRADPAHILAGPEALAGLGITVHRVERGGDATYHGPGQLVVYPILRLRDHDLGASDYMHLLEDVAIATLADFGIGAGRREGYIGVWVGGDKLCALGVRVMRGITMHGLALNVAPDMAHWATIVPCGIRDGGVGSMADVLGRAPAIDAVGRRLAGHLARALGATLTWEQAERLPWPDATAEDAPAWP
jgi:lipoate-protein ligase B